MPTQIDPRTKPLEGETFVIDRSVWLRGECDSQLRREKDGKCCCMGLIALQQGFTKEEITCKYGPATLGWTVLLDDETQKANQISCDMMDVNDSFNIRETARETSLSSLAHKAGFSLTFIN